jgi:hypothetical protein
MYFILVSFLVVYFYSIPIVLLELFLFSLLCGIHYFCSFS